MIRTLFATLLVLSSLTSIATADEEEEQSAAEVLLAENPGGPDDDSYTNPESLPHRAGYNQRAEFDSLANTVNQLEEDDRIKDRSSASPASTVAWTAGIK
jgi:hypothetical protein